MSQSFEVSELPNQSGRRINDSENTHLAPCSPRLHWILFLDRRNCERCGGRGFRVVPVDGCAFLRAFKDLKRLRPPALNSVKCVPFLTRWVQCRGEAILLARQPALATVVDLRCVAGAGSNVGLVVEPRSGSQ